MRPRTIDAERDGWPVSSRRRGERMSRQARAGKAVLVAVFSTAIALISHVLAGGTTPGVAGILAPLAFSVLVCLPLSGRVLSLPRLVISVLTSQLLFHWLFVLGAPGSTALVPGAPAGHHLQTVTVVHTGMVMTPPMDHAAASMWIGHAIAAMITVLLIRRGEKALVRVRQLAAALVRTLFPQLAQPDAARIARPRLAAVCRDQRPSPLPVFGTAMSRRGPPRRAALTLS